MFVKERKKGYSTYQDLFRTNCALGFAKALMGKALDFLKNNFKNTVYIRGFVYKF